MENGYEFMVLLRKLDLYKYYPGKLQREDVVWTMSGKLEETKIEKTGDLGMIFLHRLLSCNYEARDLEIVTESKIQLTEEKVENHCSTFSRLAKRKHVLPRSGVSQPSAVHPLDVVLAVFLCADPILQQEIATLLWKCKLAIPFVTAISECNTLFAHLWPLRSICAEWTAIKNGKLINEVESVLSPSFVTIGFMRFQSTDVTKSITINTLLSDTDKVHPIFYHRNSRGSTRKRLIADGSIEISWYLPRSSGKTLCSEPVTVLNLRGNALMYDRQRNILMEMASICFIVCSSTELDNHEVEAIVESVVKMKKKVFIITYDDINLKGMPIIEIEDDIIIFNKESLTDAQLKENVSSRLKVMILKDSLQRTSIDTFVWKEISVDLERSEIKKGLQYAETIMTSLRCEQTECMTEKLLPLHQELWYEWVETDKEMYRLKKLPKSQDIKEYKDKLAMEKEYIRKEQFNIVNRGLSGAISSFLNALDITNKMTRSVCVRWLQIQMDQLSRRELRQLHDRETIIREIITSKNINGEDQNNLQKELQTIQELKSKSHIGLEHFFRELGQIFEAIEDQPPGQQCNLGYDLPLLAARFLLDGYSLEIFDGDVGAVPITWISAVFQRLTDMIKTKMGGENPRCTVVTVYGMQNSGKSTLLNTVFGCQFNNGAGRSTKGVQIQILKMNNSTHEGRNVDYVLIVDTEGVRSTDVPVEVRKSRDNELTAFVIGLGQKTLINIMGENTTYLTEILPIVACAFLRMDRVCPTASCDIVYQNVDSQCCGEMSSQNRKLQQKLNNEIYSVCQIERKETRRFQDVIKFDVEKDIHYIPSLWENEMPMATVTKGYSHGILKLRNCFQEFFSHCKSQSLDSISSHIKCLSTAIAKDNFLYVFQNAAEMGAREQLNKFWCDSVWKLRMNASKCETKMHTNIQNCSSSEKLEEVSKRCRDAITLDVISDFEDKKANLTDFIEATQQMYKTYMLQWKASINDGMTRAKDDLVLDVQQNIVRLQRLQESRLLVEKTVKQLKDRIRQDITEYFKGEGSKNVGIDGILSREQIRQAFEDAWRGYASSVENIGHWRKGKSNILCEAFNVLREKFRNQEASVIEKWSILSCDTVLDFQLQLSHLLKKYVPGDTLSAAKLIVQMKIETVRKRLTELTQDPSLYKTGLLEEIIAMVSDMQNKLEIFGIKTTQEFEIDISIVVASMGISAFAKSENTFLDSFNPRRLLEHKKETCYFLFEKYYNKAFFTLSFTKRVSEILVSVIKKQVEVHAEMNVADDMRHRVYAGLLHNKKTFLCTILCRMASDGDFRRFMDYIQNPTCSLDYWLGRYVDEYSTADGDNPSKLRQLVNSLAMGHVNDLMVYAKQTENQLEEREDHFEELDIPVKLWVQKFTQLASTKFEMNKVRSLSDLFGDELLDFRYFCFELFQQITNMSPNFDDLTTMGKASYETMRRNVVKMLEYVTIGCRGNCPFCGEICISSHPNHAGLHETLVHRPAGCKGCKDINTGILLHESCQKLVSDYYWSFRNTKTEGKFVPYKDYKTIYPDWKIIGDPNPINSSFWEWFMFTYIDNLEKEHHAPRPVLPKSWGTYSKDEEILKMTREINR